MVIILVNVIFCYRTLLKQGPYGGKPMVKKVLVITPGSLVKVYVLISIQSLHCSVPIMHTRMRIHSYQLGFLK